MRKHISQMSHEELSFLKSKIKRKKKIVYSHHFIEKSIERGIPTWLVEKAIENGNITEYHRKSMFENRVLIRGNQTSRGNNVCVVLDIFTRRVITAFFNKQCDNHDTLDLANYTENLDIIKTLTLGKINYK